MGLETARTIAELDENNPLGSDQVKFGDDHIRMVKNVLKDDLSWLWMQNRLYSFQAGAVVTTADILYDEASLKFYHWEGTYVSGSYLVPAGSTPATAGGVGEGKWVDVGQGTFREFLASEDGASAIGGLPSSPDLSSYAKKPQSDQLARANLSLYQTIGQRSNLLILGDSITAGVGASYPLFAYASLLGQSISNFYKDGYGYPLHRNVGNAQQIFSHNGTIINAGLTQNAVSLSSGKELVFNKVEATAFGCFVVGGVSTVGASLLLQINGSTVGTYVVTAASQQEVFFPLSGGKLTSSSDKVALVASGGTVAISGAVPFLEGLNYKLIGGGNQSPLCLTAGASGQSFSYFTSNASQVAAMLDSFFATGNPATVILALGTNSIYNDIQAETPAQYVTSLQTLISTLQGLRSGVDFIITIPPQADESLWPIIKPGYTYQDYATAIRNAFPSTDIADLNLVGLRYQDGVHPSNVGHEALAKFWCAFLGVSFNPHLPLPNRADVLIGTSPIIITGGVATKDSHGVVHLSGSVVPNGASANLMTTLLSAYRPKSIRKFVVPLYTGSTHGFGVIQIHTNGEVRLVYNGVVWTELNLDGISYVI